jgi:hypothetical protein
VNDYDLNVVSLWRIAIMAMQNVTLALPEELYVRFQQTAQATQQSLADTMLRALRVGSPPRWEDAPPEYQQDLAMLDRLDDIALWRIARSQRTGADFVRLEDLLEKNANDELDPAEQVDLDRVCMEADRFMLRKAHAAALFIGADTSFLRQTSSKDDACLSSTAPVHP